MTATDKASGATTGSFSVAVDNTAPTVTALAVATTTTSVPGWLRKSGAYNVYANATDGASGIFTVKANVSTITSGQTALALSACATGCTIGGVTYAYKSANKTASSSLAAGAVSFSVTATDNANNAGTTNGSATADNTAPTVSGAAIATVVTNVPGFVSQGRDYVVYGDTSDAASGIWKLTAKASNLTTGQTALAMPACVASCSAGGVAHGYTSAATTANASLSAGSKTYTLTATDNAGNATTTSNQSVTVDNTAPTVSITFPTAGYAGGWAAGCATAGVADVCGTATDATAGVAKVQVSFRQSAAPSLYWNPGPATFSSATEVLSNTTLALPSWSFPMAAGAFTNATGYTLRALATDAAGQHRDHIHDLHLLVRSHAPARPPHRARHRIRRGRLGDARPAPGEGRPRHRAHRVGRRASGSRACPSRASTPERRARSGSRSRTRTRTRSRWRRRRQGRREDEQGRLHGQRRQPRHRPRRASAAWSFPHTRRKTVVLQVAMPATVANACQGATFKISFRARATRV